MLSLDGRSYACNRWMLHWDPCWTCDYASSYGSSVNKALIGTDLSICRQRKSTTSTKNYPRHLQVETLHTPTQHHTSENHSTQQGFNVNVRTTARMTPSLLHEVFIQISLRTVHGDTTPAPRRNLCEPCANLATKTTKSFPSQSSASERPEPQTQMDPKKRAPTSR